MTNSADNRGADIAIVGVGCRFPGRASSPSKLWDLLCDPKVVSSPLPFSKGFYHENYKYHGHTNVTKGYFLDKNGQQQSSRFDASFFGVSPTEASSFDPQLRMLLETIYEALERSGTAMESLRGSDTAVYVGQMLGDYELMMHGDPDAMATYHITGTGRSMTSSRVSYFYDWQGPSMTVDTACSSSITAVHHAILQLRSGHSRVAVAAAANLLLDIGWFVAMSNLKMLSPDGESRMWDSSANGYARGEGVAALVLKTREAAEADGDNIMCIIRGTALNQDGRTAGPTMPSAFAQAQLIRDCYSQSGLDINEPCDRPQFFEAHGTGTPAGDPVEAEAISSAFFSPQLLNSSSERQPLIVGGIKTVIGHTEATAGMAGIIKACLAIQHGTIPPNLHFKQLNPNIEPFYNNLRLSTELQPWPTVSQGSVRRASINSFGFGGSNGHIILENYIPSSTIPTTIQCDTPTLYTPLVFSANTDSALRTYLSRFADYISGKNMSDLRNIAFTLNSRRSHLPVTTSIYATSIEEVKRQIQHKLEAAEKQNQPTGIRSKYSAPSRSKPPSVLAVFTGQGAQWPQMGLDLIESSPAAKRIFGLLQTRLDQLPIEDRPSWSLLDELKTAQETSNVHTATYSQPLCVAIQIVQVEMLRAAGISFTAIVGHSSGEIAAAFAAGFVSMEDAICIAYYRGVYGVYSQGTNGEAGSMLAVGTSHEDANDLLQYDEFIGRACVAAVNSDTSVTLSGDVEAIKELATVFRDEGTFVRELKVDRAYHSHHMNPCTPHYLDALKKLNIEIEAGNQATWFSSVHRGPVNNYGQLPSQYWLDNMAMPVLFVNSIQDAHSVMGPFDVVMEIGPHAALKGPAMETLQNLGNSDQLYLSLFTRGKSSVSTISDCFGQLWSQFGSQVDLQSYESFASANRTYELRTDLPSYAWDHDEEVWHESRYARQQNVRHEPVHELLGHLTPDSTSKDMRWRQILRIYEVPWITDHRLQNVPVFPATGYIVSVLEAALVLGKNDAVQLVELVDIEIGSALVFEREDAQVEVVISLTNVTRHKHQITAQFSYHASNTKANDVLELKASGSVCIHLGEPSSTSLPAREAPLSNMLPVTDERLYQTLEELEYQYRGQFHTFYGGKRKLGAVSGYVGKIERSDMIVHPAVLDTCVQPCMLAMSSMDDEECNAMHIPKRIKRLAINPALCIQEKNTMAPLGVDIFNSYAIHAPKYICDIDIYAEDGSNALIQTEGLEFIRIAKSTQKDDRELFSEMVWAPLDAHATFLSESKRAMGCLFELVQNMMVSNPHMNVMQLGYDEKITTIILKALKNTFKAYSIIPAARNDVGSENLPSIDSTKITIRSRDWLSSLDDFAIEDKANLVIDVSLLTDSSDVTSSLDEIRNVMQLGGELITIASDADLLLSNIQTKRFSDIRTLKFESTDSVGVLVFLKATDNTRSVLSNPIAHDADELNALCTVEDLLIVHEENEFTTKLAAEIANQLEHISKTVSMIPSLNAASQVEISKDTVVLSLTDLQGSVFEGIDAVGFKALQRLILEAKSFVSITHGKTADNPHANMISGLLLSASRDVSTVDYMMLDFELRDTITASIISNALIRHCSYIHEQADKALVGIHEREMKVDATGTVLVPRVLPSKEMNDRYNAGYRDIFSDLDTASRRVCIGSNDKGFNLEWDTDEVYPDSALHTVRSLLHSVRACQFGYMSLQIVRQNETNALFASLSAKNSAVVDQTSAATVPINALPIEAGKFLCLLAKSMASMAVLEGLCEGDRVLVLEPDSAMATMLQYHAIAARIEIIFATCEPDLASKGWKCLHSTSSGRVVKATLGVDFQAFIDLTNNSSDLARLIQTIKSALADNCRYYDNAYLFGGEMNNLPERYMKMTSLRLVRAVQVVTALVEKHGSDYFQAVADVSLHDVAQGAVSAAKNDSVISWDTKDTVSLRQQPATTHVSFDANKTYWLVGLSSSLGFSLCEWMTYRGARHIVLSSRNPNIDEQWMKDMKEQDVEIRVCACDITDKESLNSAYEYICSTMPPIGGVTQGAMVLKDTAFDKMALSDFTAVTQPKVEGSIYLEDIFHDIPLDFFIAFSSIASVMGNFGQVNYSAANAFMTSLVAQRRKRGLAGSVMHIGPIFGVGYLTRSDAVSTMGTVAMQRSGFSRTSERQFHQLFAEAVLAGSTNSTTGGFEVISGISSESLSKAPRNTLASCTRVTHFRQTDQDQTRLSDKQSSMVSAKEQIADASDQKQIYSIVWHGLLAKLDSDMHIKLDKFPKAEQGIMRFNQLGVDSLAAAEIRSWFMAELGVKVPVLSILNGSSIGDLVSAVAEDLFAEVNKAKDNESPDGTTTESSDLSSGEDESVHYGSAFRGSIDDTTASSDGDDHIVKSAPVSFTQARFYPAGLFLKDRVGLNHTIWGEFVGDIDVGRFGAAVDAVVADHDILRTAFFNLGDTQMQHVMEMGHNRLEHIIIESEEDVIRVRNEIQYSYNYNVSRGETLRIILLNTQDQAKHFLVFGLHPLVLDTSSFVTMVNCISEYYTMPQRTQQVTQFLDVSNQQLSDFESGKFASEVEYWTDEFITDPSPLPLLTLAKVDERPVLSSYGNLRSTCKIDLQTKDTIATACRKMQITPCHFYMAALRATLLQFSRMGEDVTFVMAENGRGFDVESANVIGCLYNLVPTRLVTKTSTSFKDLATLARDKVYSGLANARLPYTAILEQLALKEKVKQDPVFQVFFDYRSGQRMTMPIAKGLDLKLEEIEFNVPYDVSLDIIDGAGEEGDHVLMLRKDMFDQQAVDMFAETYKTLVTKFAKSQDIALGEAFTE